eukprot:gene767-11416_t
MYFGIDDSGLVKCVPPPSALVSLQTTAVALPITAFLAVDSCADVAAARVWLHLALPSCVTAPSLRGLVLTQGNRD